MINIAIEHRYTSNNVDSWEFTMKTLYEENEVLYIKESPHRVRLLQYLSSKDDFTKTSELAENLKIKRGTVHHHIKGLKNKGLIDIERSTVRSVYIKITEKGKQAIMHIGANRKKGGKSNE